MGIHRSLTRGALILSMSLGTGPLAAAPRSFATPDAAVQALVDAGRTGEAAKVQAVLGSDAKPLMTSGDAVADKEAGQRFLEKYDQSHQLVPGNNGTQTLVIGSDGWPFPLPLVKGKSGWFFDSKAGAQEILARRVGQNELDTVQVCLAYVDGQREYRELNPEGASPSHYAGQLISSKGKHDGLYWPAAAGEAESPLGPKVGGRSEGYSFEAGKPAPYHGYFYRILTAQGPHAEGGAVNYLVAGKLYGGFALVAWPATYRNSGVMTFLVNHAGVVFQKDLGPKTASVAKSMTRFDPDSTWSRAQP